MVENCLPEKDLQISVLTFLHKMYIFFQFTKILLNTKIPYFSENKPY